jgi:hypothetical protein
MKMGKCLRLPVHVHVHVYFRIYVQVQFEVRIHVHVLDRNEDDFFVIKVNLNA